MDEISGMENKLFEEDQVSPDSTPTRCQETSEGTMNEEYETKAEEWECQFEVQHILLEPESSSLSYLINCNETSVEPGMVRSSVTAADEPNIKHFCEELLYSSAHKSKYNPVHLPLHTACPSPFLPRGSSDEIPERVHKIRVRKHKPSAISFSDFEFLSLGTNAKFHICEVTETSEEDEERGGDDDVFTELPQPGVFLNGLHKRAVSQGKGEEQEHCTSQHIHHVESSCEHSEGNLDSYKREEKQMALVTQPETGSEWSDSMSCLMKKLEQLNLDIEEALSAGSSPTNTPCTKRRKETCAIKVETDPHRDHQRKGICTSKKAGYQELDGLPCPVSSGARPKNDVLFQKLSREKAELHPQFFPRDTSIETGS